MAKYEQLRPVPRRHFEELSASVDPNTRRNNIADIELLAYLKANAVDFFVTEDVGIHRRATRVNLEERALFVADAIRLLQRKYEPNTIRLPYISQRKAYELDIRLPIFDSLREGYPEFDEWFAEKCQRAQRECWVIEVENEVVGIVIYKEETKADTDANSDGRKFLKLCTFKMSPSFRGERFGEQLLKQALWHAASNNFDVVYLTAFEDQAVLVGLLKHFGFQATYRNKRGELVLEKKIPRTVIKPKGMAALEAAMINYPKFYSGDEVAKFIIPIQDEYFARLFPEKDGRRQRELFMPNELGSQQLSSQKIPGNTIRKVYVSRSGITKVRPGDIVLFYKSFTSGDDFSQSVTTLGIVEGFSEALDQDDLVKMTSKRSVFSEKVLREMYQGNSQPVKVLDFILIDHFDAPIGLSALTKMSALKAPPISITSISDDAFEKIMDKGRLRP
ncbi:MAG: GNAT family N-acetyltransferase [Mesorhizobium amorphae]|nr:MAG: GNAT family N-acetyltransferase [Mesorhizobium amorphae]